MMRWAGGSTTDTCENTGVSPCANPNPAGASSAALGGWNGFQGSFSVSGSTAEAAVSCVISVAILDVDRPGSYYGCGGLMNSSLVPNLT